MNSMNMSLLDPAEFARANAAAGHFVFRGPDGTLRARGTPSPVPSGTGATRQARVSQALAEGGTGSVLAGALPFRRDGADCLWLAAGIDRQPLHATTAHACAPDPTLRAEPAAAKYAETVAEALRIMTSDPDGPDRLRKIVLARSLTVHASRPINPDLLQSRLAEDPTVTTFHVALRDASFGDSPAVLVGASPEILVEKRAGRIMSNPLAGSAPRHADPTADAEACAGLAGSDKDRREHAMVVEYILDTLAPCCRQLGCPDGTGLTCTRSMWHLGTRITGELKDDSTPSILLATMLHPTPAVCGLPCDRAAALIERLEPVGRDYYAGAVGWCDTTGDGAWHVAIRCARIAGNQARLYAGAGIVPGSDPASEAAETGNKFAALLRALGLPADAAMSATT